MEIRDATLGKVGLVSTAAAFVLFAAWINAYPFIDEDSIIYSYIPDPQWVLLACAAWGLCFIGGLMSFTLYHVYSHL